MEQGEGDGRGQGPQLVAEQVDQPPPEVREEGRQPVRGRGALEGLEHDERVLPGQIVLRLSQVGRSKPGLFPEPEQVGGEPEGDAEVLELLRGTLPQLQQERREVLPRREGFLQQT